MERYLLDWLLLSNCLDWPSRSHPSVLFIRRDASLYADEKETQRGTVCLWQKPTSNWRNEQCYESFERPSILFFFNRNDAPRTISCLIHWIHPSVGVEPLHLLFVPPSFVCLSPSPSFLLCLLLSSGGAREWAFNLMSAFFSPFTHLIIALVNIFRTTRAWVSENERGTVHIHRNRGKKKKKKRERKKPYVISR